jgi:hypothetical protein
MTSGDLDHDANRRPGADASAYCEVVQDDENNSQLDGGGEPTLVPLPAPERPARSSARPAKTGGRQFDKGWAHQTLSVRSRVDLKNCR